MKRKTHYAVYAIDGDDEYFRDMFDTKEEAISDAERRHRQDERLGEKYTRFCVYAVDEDGEIDESRGYVHVTDGK